MEENLVIKCSTRIPFPGDAYLNDTFDAAAIEEIKEKIKKKHQIVRVKNFKLNLTRLYLTKSTSHTGNHGIAHIYIPEETTKTGEYPLTPICGIESPLSLISSAKSLKSHIFNPWVYFA